jgi:hypothetical protein
MYVYNIYYYIVTFKCFYINLLLRESIAKDAKVIHWEYTFYVVLFRHMFCKWP